MDFKTIASGLGLEVPNDLTDGEITIEKLKEAQFGAPADSLPPAARKIQKAAVSAALKGVPKTEEHKRKISETLRGNELNEAQLKNLRFWNSQPKSKTHKKSLSISIKKYKTECPHCGKIGGTGMFRWHFDNCREK